MFDLLGMHWHTLKAVRNPACDHRPSPSAQALPESLELDYPSLESARAAGFTLVDIRESWERTLDDGGPALELHVPLSALLQGQASLPRNARYLIVCAHGVRSLGLAGHLREQGYAAVYSLAGGLEGK
jgi:rhodanese-related sulfurtransferase